MAGDDNSPRKVTPIVKKVHELAPESKEAGGDRAEKSGNSSEAVKPPSEGKGRASKKATAANNKDDKLNEANTAMPDAAAAPKSHRGKGGKEIDAGTTGKSVRQMTDADIAAKLAEEDYEAGDAALDGDGEEKNDAPAPASSGRDGWRDFSEVDAQAKKEKEANDADGPITTLTHAQEKEESAPARQKAGRKKVTGAAVKAKAANENNGATEAEVMGQKNQKIVSTAAATEKEQGGTATNVKEEKLKKRIISEVGELRRSARQKTTK